MAARSMFYHNGNVLCSIDTETTGLDPFVDDLYQVAIIPLDSNLDPMTDILPFDIKIRVENPEEVINGSKFQRSQKSKILEACKYGVDPFTALTLLEEWIEQLKLGVAKTGNPYRILPLGHNYAFDKAFLQKWMGPEQYGEWFHYHFRDTMITAGFMTDCLAFQAEVPPFPQVKLQYLCTKLGIENPQAHDALSDALATSQVYKHFCRAYKLVL